MDAENKLSHIRSVLHVSTAHVPSADMKRLEEGKQYPLTAQGFTSAWLHVPREDTGDLFEEMQASGFGFALPMIFGMAIGLGCDYILLDGAGPIHPDLPVFEWPMEAEGAA